MTFIVYLIAGVIMYYFISNVTQNVKVFIFNSNPGEKRCPFSATRPLRARRESPDRSRQGDRRTAVGQLRKMGLVPLMVTESEGKPQVIRPKAHTLNRLLAANNGDIGSKTTYMHILKDIFLSEP